MNTFATPQEAFYELSYYTLSLHDVAFIHQNAVDAFTAQHADENTKAIAITFALIGMYLHLEKGYSGQEVQRAHMQLGKTKRSWPEFDLSKDRGDFTVFDALSAPAGAQRDAAIHKWCKSVWQAYHQSHEAVAQLWANVTR